MKENSILSRLLVGYFLLFIFGFYGIHRIILGRPYSGVFYAFTGGFFGIGLIFDFFIGVPYMSIMSKHSFY